MGPLYRPLKFFLFPSWQRERHLWSQTSPLGVRNNGWPPSVTQLDRTRGGGVVPSFKILPVLGVLCFVGHGTLRASQVNRRTAVDIKKPRLPSEIQINICREQIKKYKINLPGSTWYQAPGCGARSQTGRGQPMYIKAGRPRATVRRCRSTTHVASLPAGAER